MLSGVKKVLLYLGAACLVLILAEVLFQSYDTRFSSRNAFSFWVSDPVGAVSLSQVNLGTPVQVRAEENPKITRQKNTSENALEEEKIKLRDGYDDPNPPKVIEKEDRMISRTESDVDNDSGDDDDQEERRLRNSPYIYHEDEEKKRLSESPPSNDAARKLISYFLPRDLENRCEKRFSACQYKNCRCVDNMSRADAILFSAPMVRDHLIPSFPRPKSQRWIFFTYDPAVKNYGLSRPDVRSQFNWTMTYQLHSDYPQVFGTLQKRKPPQKDYEILYNRKDKVAAWFVSHCQTWGRREEYVARMRRILPVDIFGKCGNLSCGPVHYRTNDRSVCLPMLTQRYKFYLAFENSFCKDYVSEKFFKLFQDVDVVPVVRGGFNYKKYLPSGIFVDASDFKTPEALARYLLKLGQDKDKYTAMLRRKSEWIEAPVESFHCAVCRALHTANPGPHYHQDLQAKFNGDPPDCWKPTDLA